MAHGERLRAGVVGTGHMGQYHVLVYAELPEAELQARRAQWKPRPTHYRSGTLWKYAQLVGDAEKGAITHPGGKAETKCYADI